MSKLRADGAPVDEIAASRQMMSLLERLVSSLPPDLREALILSATEELTSAEISQVLGIPEGSVRTRLLRAREILPRNSRPCWSINMHDDEPDPFLDELLEASLKQYRGEEPRSGLEMRILAGIRTRERAARRRGLGWAVAVCAGILAVIALTLHFASSQLRQPTPSASLPQPATTQPAPPMVSRQHPLLSPRRPEARVRRVATRRSRPEQFPTPLPLTEQEKLLLAYFNKTAKPDSIPGTDENSAGGLEIPRIIVAALQIEPLDDSQSEQGK